MTQGQSMVRPCSLAHSTKAHRDPWDPWWTVSPDNQQSVACNNKSYLLVNTWDKVPIGGKSSGDQNAAKMDFYGGNCDYKVFEMG